jgi:thiol-disulfide isomerase/thioredoxin
MRDRYSIAVGLIFFAVVVVAVLHRGGGAGNWALGLDPAPEHWALPEFAVPLATPGSPEGDANVAQDDCGSSALPCGDPRTPACEVREPGSFNACDLFSRPSVISFWFTSDGGCVAQQDVVDRVYGRYRGRVSFLSLDVHDDPDKVRELDAERGWTMPVGYDRDGAAAGLYHVGGCPTFAFALPGGTLWRATIGELTAAQLSGHIDQLLRETRAVEAGGAG